ncbi:hypothetical protein NUU61_005809 [Penicillium alfredii]|uniref:Uncharacterized protein n=1 Tax=Penicillium alfredii TaxID=1506179 RepID=A0A9W9FA56_9EURO|nr:uncharacterized protein NUU61_005809 [Penicillium alfredii]KAJ5096453.1 hypothetical protein NUU61_005809 [Penicillium alfredii]
MESDYLRPPEPIRIKRKPVSNPDLRVAPDPTGRTAHAASTPALVPTPLSQPPPTSTSGAAAATPPPPTPAQKAYGEARHFLGGLINHPTESNRHVTILRHSHGLVFYCGNSTSVEVSIFADAPLPSDRTLWLQSKGWTGKTGMRAKALLRLRDNWLEVTPAMPLRAEQVNPDDERAWQRDIKKFRKKAPVRPRNRHQLRETAVVRIPADAGDGYFQLVLCQGAKKKVLGNSPVFRVLSTSTSPSSIRGASLSTLPLEVGAMVVSLYVQTAARTAMTPAASAIKTRVDRYRPPWLDQTAAHKAYSASGAQDRVNGIVNFYRGTDGRAHSQATSSELVPNDTVVLDDGPQPPFPMNFKARGQLDHVGSPASPCDTPRITLSKMPDWVTEHLRGYFFGWARFHFNSSKEAPESPWCPSVLSVRTLDPLQATRVNLAEVSKRVVTLRLLDEVPLQTSKVEVRVMGFLRSDIPPPTGSTSEELAEAHAAAAEAAILADAYDASVVQNTLGHVAWAADELSPAELQRQNSGWIDRTREGYANLRMRGQKLVEQVPLYRLGVRSATDQIREQQVALNGFYIVR